MRPKPRLTPFVQRARELGADGAKQIRVDSVVTAPWVRLKCQFGCGGWGSTPASAVPRIRAPPRRPPR